MSGNLKMKSKEIRVSYIDGQGVRHLLYTKNRFNTGLKSTCGELHYFSSSHGYNLKVILVDTWYIKLCPKCIKELPDKKRKEVVHAMITYKLKSK